METSAQNTADISHLVTQFKAVPGGLLPLLHAIQAELGYVPDSVVPSIAIGLNLSRAEVHGFISFYHDFKTHPVGQHTVQICRSEACQSMGSRQLEAHAKALLGVDYHETTEDGAITLEPVYCLGNCACAPSVRINNDIHARVDTERFDDLMADLDAGMGVPK